MWKLGFISEQDFLHHVKATIEKYGDNLASVNLKKFNSNLVDPIKLIFDKSVYSYSWEDIIKNEISRQRDKSNNNSIGYFHQRIFQYIQHCEVPKEGWDVIYRRPEGITLAGGETVRTVYVEMKNKHNTMNSASSAKTYMKAQHQLLADDDCACYLVEAIARHSQDIAWSVTLDGRRVQHRRIRRVSMDKFYEFVTGDPDAFFKMCVILPETIQRVITEYQLNVPQDTVMEELETIAQDKNCTMAMALYLLGFSEYQGFAQL